MTSEIWQFAGFVGIVGVMVALWMGIIYLPRRTLEHRYDAAAGASKPAEDGVSAESADLETSPSQSASDPTR